MLDARIDFECNIKSLGMNLSCETNNPQIDAAFNRGEPNSMFLWYINVINTENINYTYEIDGKFTARIVRLDGIIVRFIDDQISVKKFALNANEKNMTKIGINRVANFNMITFDKRPYEFLNGDVVVSVNGEIYYCSGGHYYHALFRHNQLKNEIVLKNTEITRDALIELTGLNHEF